MTGVLESFLKHHIQFNWKLIQQGIENGEFKADHVEQLAVIIESTIIGLSRLSSGLDRGALLLLYV
ncbi:TetR family transcriptional regulator C-terminal domain-containing protein [Paenibacillus farraposensis]|uniref:TetR family transcriptional regulator C-terminal domain-containing protein n=1 Tax=Paenibacillus farraposensis TaxID=2807095 RepID=A0ABW4DG20_9BACL|nr:TetR family transcriptional regulator C-terminal domain-containing protein [Paenibacillus farraposensis]